jgi:hypothetical protein
VHGGSVDCHDVDPLVDLQKKCIEPVENKGAQCEADQHGGEDVADHVASSLDQGKALRVDVGSDERSSECSDCHAVVLRSVCAGVHRARLLLGAQVDVCVDCVCHGVLRLLM